MQSGGAVLALWWWWSWCCGLAGGYEARRGGAWNGRDRFHKYPRPSKGYAAPEGAMVDVVNNLGLRLLAVHNERNENNIAISPYGALAVLVALGEGIQGDAVREIQFAAQLPNDISVIRVGLRDIHRHLKSYFIPREGFLAGLTLNQDNVTLNPEYEEILRFYGYDVMSFSNVPFPGGSTEGPQKESGDGGATDPSTQAATTAETVTTAAPTEPAGGSGTTEDPQKESGDAATTAPSTEAATTDETLATAAPTEPATAVPEEPAAETTTTTTAAPVETAPTTIAEAVPEEPTEAATEAAVSTVTETTTAAPTPAEETAAPTIPGEAVTETTAAPEEVTQGTTESTATTTEATDPDGATGDDPPSETTESIPTTPAEPTEGTPLEPTEGIPAAPTEGTPLEATEDPPLEPTESAPTEPTPGVPNEPTEGTPLEPTEGIPAAPTEGTPLEATEDPPLEPTESAPTEPTPGVPNEPTEGTPLEPTEGIPAEPNETAPTESTEGTPPESTEGISAEPTEGTPIEPTEEATAEPTTATPPEPTEGVPLEPTEDTPSAPTGDAPEEPATLPEDLSEVIPATDDVQDEQFGGQAKRKRSENLVELNLIRPQNRRNTRSIVDYVIARYYDEYRPNRRWHPPERPGFLVYGRYREYHVSFMRYDTVLPFYYVPHLDAMALSFPLDNKNYYLLLVLPVEDDGIDRLVCDLRLNGSLRYIIDNLRERHVVATIPSFSLKGYVVLTPSFQELGIKKIFEPRQADFTPMTRDRDIYVRNIEQAITVNIRSYVDPNSLEHQRSLNQYSPVEFKADHPFVYFVIDSKLQIALMTGKIVNPLNSRISMTFDTKSVATLRIIQSSKEMPLAPLYRAIGRIFGDENVNVDDEPDPIDFESGVFLDCAISWVQTFKRLILPADSRLSRNKCRCPAICDKQPKCKT